MMPAVPKPIKRKRTKTLKEVFNEITPPRKRVAMESNPLEEMEQIAVAQWLDAIGVVWCHVPNGGYRHAVTAMRLRRHGVKPGVPDILIFSRVKRIILETMPDGSAGDPVLVRGVAIELKRRKGGIISEDQQNWMNNLAKEGWITRVCHGSDDAIQFLESLGYGRRS